MKKLALAMLIGTLLGCQAHYGYGYYGHSYYGNYYRHGSYYGRGQHYSPYYDPWNGYTRRVAVWCDDRICTCDGPGEHCSVAVQQQQPQYGSCFMDQYGVYTCCRFSKECDEIRANQNRQPKGAE